MASGNSTLRNALLPAVDALRGIPNQLGLRLYTVTVRVRTWSGARVGMGTKTDVDSPLKVASGGGPVKVTQLSQKDVIVSGGQYEDAMYEIGPITPPYVGSTLDDDQIAIFNPPVTGMPTEVFFNITGPGMLAPGVWCEKVSQNVTKNFRYTFVLKRTARQV